MTCWCRYRTRGTATWAALSNKPGELEKTRAKDISFLPGQGCPLASSFHPLMEWAGENPPCFHTRCLGWLALQHSKGAECKAVILVIFSKESIGEEPERSKQKGKP